MNYTSAQVCQAADLSYRQLDYACHYIFQDQQQGRPGTGNKRYFTAEQAIRLMIVGTLLKAGLMQESAGRIAQQWNETAMYYADQHEAVTITLNVGALWHQLNTLFPQVEEVHHAEK